MSSQRILQVITRSNWGGAPCVVESLATQIDEVAAVACGPGGRLIDRFEKRGVPVHVQPRLQSSPHPKDALAYRDLRRLIAEGEFDIVHSHSTKAGVLARIAASRAGIASFFTVHRRRFYNTEHYRIKRLSTGFSIRVCGNQLTVGRKPLHLFTMRGANADTLSNRRLTSAWLGRRQHSSTWVSFALRACPWYREFRELTQMCAVYKIRIQSRIFHSHQVIKQARTIYRRRNQYLFDIPLVKTDILRITDAR